MMETVDVRVHHTDAVAALRNRCLRVVADPRRHASH
jgi:hypothetical protein